MNPLHPTPFLRRASAHAVVLALAVLAMLLAACGHFRFDPVATDGFQLIESREGRYYAYVPKDAAERMGRGERLPVIVYLHGGGESGTDAVVPTQVGLGPFVQSSHGAFPFVVLFPQCPRGHYWPEPTQLARLTRLIDDAMPRLGGDPDRVYVTGNSMGGYGTWALAAQEPKRFAAIVPICGGVKPPRGYPIPENGRVAVAGDPYVDVAKALGKIPVWAFHGTDDWLVSVGETRKIVAALRANGNDARFTEYPRVGHVSWNRAYADPALFEWLAKQRRDDAPR